MQQQSEIKTNSNKSKFSSILSRKYYSNIDLLEKDSQIFQHCMYETGSTNRMSLRQNLTTHQKADRWMDATDGKCQYGSNANESMSLISKKTYQKKYLYIEQLTYFCNFLFLQKGIKNFCYADAQVFQTFHYMIHNKQKIPTNTIQDVLAISNVSNLSRSELSGAHLLWIGRKQTIGIYGSEERKKLFIPPIGLALDLIKNKQAKLNLNNLKAIFNGCFDIKSVGLFKQINSKIIVFNQFAEMVELFDLISEKNGEKNFAQLNQYLQNSRKILDVNRLEQVLDRFFPQSKIRYIKAFSQSRGFNQDIAQYLFILLKSASKLTERDFKIFFNSSHSVEVKPLVSQQPSKNPPSFNEIQKEIVKLFNHVNIEKVSQFNKFQQALNFEKCVIQDTIISHYILSVLSELSYRKFIFPLTLTKKLNDIMMNIPHHRIKKIICFILLSQKQNILSQKKIPKSEFHSLVNYQKMDHLLEQTRSMALNMLLLDNNNFEFQQQYFQTLLDLVQNSSNILIVTQISKVLFKFKQNLPQNGLQKLLNMTKNHPKPQTQVQILKILFQIFKNPNISIKSSLTQTIFQIFTKSNNQNVQNSSFQILIQTTKRKEFPQIIDIILKKCTISLFNFNFVQQNQKQQVFKTTFILKINGISQKICFLVYKIFQNLSKHNQLTIEEKKQAIQNELCTIYQIVTKQQKLKNCFNDIINAFNYALINQLSIPQQIFTHINNQMQNKKEYQKGFESTPIYKFSQQIQKQNQQNPQYFQQL